MNMKMQVSVETNIDHSLISWTPLDVGIEKHYLLTNRWMRY